MRKVPVYFDQSIDLAAIMQFAASINCTLRGNSRGELVVTPNSTGSATLPIKPSNVIDLRGAKCAR